MKLQAVAFTSSRLAFSLSNSLSGIMKHYSLKTPFLLFSEGQVSTQQCILCQPRVGAFSRRSQPLDAPAWSCFVPELLFMSAGLGTDLLYLSAHQGNPNE